MLRTIRLYGDLGKKFGKVHHLHVASVGEAIRALSANYKGFRQHLIDSQGVAGYEVWDGKYNLSKEDTDNFHKTGEKDIKIIPRVRGAGNVGKIIAGVALIALAVSPLGLGSFSAAFGQGAGMWGVAANFGASLILGGIVGMMTETSFGTSIDSNEDNTQSYLFSGAMNTTKQGNPVFIAYGTHLLGSQVISASLTTSDVPV